jgi:hypothetical protein
MKICPVGAELFHAGGRTDAIKLIITFRNFEKKTLVFHNCRYIYLPTGIIFEDLTSLKMECENLKSNFNLSAPAFYI